MKRVLYIVVLLLVAVLAFIAGRYKGTGGPTASSARKILYYVDPMHPAYKSDKPGIAPDCGMKLEPVYADGMGAEAGEDGKLPAGTVNISPEKQQMIGVQVASVEESRGKRTLRILGRVAADETRIYRINAAVDGWIQDAQNNSTGSLVKKGEKLGSFYSPEFLAAEQAFIFNLSAQDRFQATGQDTPEQQRLGRAGVQTYAESLFRLGMSQMQIEELRRTRQLTQDIWIISPVSGLILTRNISPGQRFEKGLELFKIADLSRVWILADAFENEAQYFRPGMKATVTVPSLGKTLSATVSEVPPQFDAATRTLKIRLEADNPGLVLRPDMFANVELPMDLPPGPSIPVDAIIDSGLQKRVFVDRGNGHFEPREVETGWRQGDRVQVVKGLMAGERIVVSGTFLVDSESRLKAAAAGIFSAAVKDPVCGMEIDQQKARAAGRVVEYQGTAVYFCSEQCKRDFQKSPAQYQKSEPPPPQPSPRPQMKSAQVEDSALDPKCGMTVNIAGAKKAGLTSKYRGKTYYFCSGGCKEEFDSDPENVLNSRGKVGHGPSNEGGSHD
ncbi:MAG: efflux RND transporter periplasmic adaptor subunit [Terriglobales bacterium]